MVRSTDEFCVALNSADVSRLGHAAARLVLLMGEVVVIGFAARVLERTVCLFVFLLRVLANCVPYSGSLSQAIAIPCAVDDSNGECRAITMGAFAQVD
jgi:hypothetical protein